MGPIPEWITTRRGVLAEQAELLEKQLAEIEFELAEITTAERVVTRLHAEDESAVADDAQGPEGDSAMGGGAGHGGAPG